MCKVSITKILIHLLWLSLLNTSFQPVLKNKGPYEERRQSLSDLGIIQTLRVHGCQKWRTEPGPHDPESDQPVQVRIYTGHLEKKEKTKQKKHMLERPSSVLPPTPY